MRRDNWNNPRIEFWQAIYEKLIEKYRNKKIRINDFKKQAEPVDELCRTVGNKIKNIRKQNGLTQKQLAGKMKISQQLISRIENGRENISVIALKNVAAALNSRIFLDIK
ncbi:MAG: helix-turn-helix transcriptional regulator [bacterium]